MRKTAERQIKFNNYSLFRSKKDTYNIYDWCVFVDEDKAAIDEIKAIEYILHPTFANPVRVVEDKYSKFSLFSSGWGVFTLKIRITFNDRSKYEMEYSLKLNDEWPKKNPPKNFSNNERQAVYDVLVNEKVTWRKIDTIIKISSLPSDIVLKELAALEKDD